MIYISFLTFKIALKFNLCNIFTFVSIQLFCFLIDKQQIQITIAFKNKDKKIKAIPISKNRKLIIFMLYDVISSCTKKKILINQYKKTNFLNFSCETDVRNDSTTKFSEWKPSIVFSTQENQKIKGTLMLSFI